MTHDSATMLTSAVESGCQIFSAVLRCLYFLQLVKNLWFQSLFNIYIATAVLIYFSYILLSLGVIYAGKAQLDPMTICVLIPFQYQKKGCGEFLVAFGGDMSLFSEQVIKRCAFNRQKTVILPVYYCMFTCLSSSCAWMVTPFIGWKNSWAF